MAFVLYEFVGKNQVKIGRRSWIVSYFEKDLFCNEKWDSRDVIEVGWPTNGSLTCTKPGSALYAVKVLWISDDKSELEKMKEQLKEGNTTQQMGRGHRVKKRKIIESDSSDGNEPQRSTAPKPKKSKTSKGRLNELMKEILEEEPQGMDEKDTIIQSLREEVEQLKLQKREQKMENRNLRRTIRLMTNLPDLLSQMTEMRNWRTLPASPKPSTPDVIEMEMQQDQDHQATITSTKPINIAAKVDAIIHRCNNQEASKLVNDLMTALYSVEYMASHTLTGAIGPLKLHDGSPTKGQMDLDVVNEIIARVTKAFPSKTPTEIRGIIRQKLSNAVKTIKRKQKTFNNSNNEQ